MLVLLQYWGRRQLAIADDYMQVAKNSSVVFGLQEQLAEHWALLLAAATVPANPRASTSEDEHKPHAQDSCYQPRN